MRAKLARIHDTELIMGKPAQNDGWLISLPAVGPRLNTRHVIKILPALFRLAEEVIEFHRSSAHTVHLDPSKAVRNGR